MALDKGEALLRAREYLETYRAVDSSDYEVIQTRRGGGRWRVDFRVEGLDERVIIRMDDETGELLIDRWGYASENLKP